MVSAVAAALPPFVAHRFGRAYGPDSSPQALERALSQPVGGLETDCCLTADDQIALVHDPYLAHAATLDGWIDRTPLATFLDARLRDRDGRVTDQRPLPFEALLERVAGLDLTLQLEVKAYTDVELADRTARRVCALLPDAIRDMVEVISFWPSACAIAAAEGLRTRVIVACPYAPEALAAWAGEHAVSGVILEAPYWSWPVVERWRAADLSIMCGAVNDAELVRRVLPFAPDLVSTDRPHELAAELRA